MFIVAGGFAVGNVILSTFVGQRKRTRTKLMPYECGKDPVGSARERFSVKFYLIAMIFILFDIEVIFLVPWAAVYKALASQSAAMRSFAYLEMMIFVGLLFVGYIGVVNFRFATGGFDLVARRFLDVGREDDDWKVWIKFAQLGEDFDAVHAVHDHIEDDQVVTVEGVALKRLRAVGRLLDGMAEFFQKLAR